MATVSFIKYERQSPSALSRVSDYVKQEQKTMQEDGMQLISGQNCSPQFATQEFLATRQMHRKDSPVYFYHYVQSFHPDEPVTGELAHEVAREFAARAWPESEVLIATHIDAEHIHSHFIVNAVCYESGKMLRQGPNTLATLRPISDEICMRHGLSVLPKQQKRKAHGMTGREYRTAVKGESWKFRLMNTIDDCMRFAHTREEFIALMKSEGYGVRWERTRQNITYTIPSGYQCRDDRLHDEKYLKEAMEHEFGIRQRIILGGIEAAKSSAAEYTTGAGSAAAHTARAASDAGGMGRPANQAQRAVPGDSGADGASEAAIRQGIPVSAEGAVDGTGAGNGGDTGDARTGWEAERAALFAPPAQTQSAAPVPSAAAHPSDVTGIVGGVVKLGHAVERAENDISHMSDATTMGTHTDSKALRKLREKKIAAGHKPNDHEDEELTMRQTMY